MRTAPIGLLVAICSLMLSCRESARPSAQATREQDSQAVGAGDSFALGATSFKAAAQAGLDKAVDACRYVDCDADLVSQMGGLQTAVTRLGMLLDERPLNHAAIINAIRDASTLIQSICAQLGLQCTTSEAGAAADGESSLRSGILLACPSEQERCESEAWERRGRCLTNVGKWKNCRQRIPFQYWQGWPFDPGSYQSDCREFIGPTDLPNDRCPCPDFASERFAGCPSFFQTGVECDIGDCRSYLPCQRSGDPRCSCGRNLAVCDLCEWRNYTFLGGDFRESSCARRYTNDVDYCRTLSPYCCTPPDPCP